jgi:hypothetical protein
MAKFNPAKFMLSAVSDDPTRLFLSRPYYDSAANAIISTDGVRMHIWRNPSFTYPSDTYVGFADGIAVPMAVDGYPANNYAGSQGPFPAWRKVVPAPEALNIEPEPYSFKLFDTAAPVFCVRYGVAINLKFLKALQSTEWLAYFHKEPKRANATIMFVHENFVALMCPMRIED